MRTQALAGSVSQAKEAAEGRAQERLCQLESELQRAAVADRDSAVAIVRKSDEGLQATRVEFDAAESNAQPEAISRRRVEQHARAAANPVAAT